MRVANRLGLPGIVAAVLAGPLVAQEIDFERDVVPILTRYGCNAGACHGKQRGQNGFQLSLLGFDPDFDHAALCRNCRSVVRCWDLIPISTMRP